MRIDKFLKVSRLIKRREIAKELCEDQDVFLNGKPAKPSSEIAPGDELLLCLGRHRVKVRIKEIRTYSNKENAADMYELIEDVVVNRGAEDD